MGDSDVAELQDEQTSKESLKYLKIRLTDVFNDRNVVNLQTSHNYRQGQTAEPANNIFSQSIATNSDWKICR